MACCYVFTSEIESNHHAHVERQSVHIFGVMIMEYIKHIHASVSGKTQTYERVANSTEEHEQKKKRKKKKGGVIRG